MQNAGNDAARVAADARARKQTPGAIRVNGIDVGAEGIYPELAHSVEQLSDLAAECERLRAENRDLLYRAQSLTGEMERLQAENRA
ncbi:MAG TPA: hypothetical protein VM223_21245, partial [Planctomycetota bacterium]|nr:hypothetical protein [Planctomycetota bacterium]